MLVECEEYPVGALLRSALLWMCSFCMGLCEVMKGPTLLDLKDLLGVSISQVSLIIPAASFGGLSGCFLLGLVMDRLARFRYCTLAFIMLLMGVSFSILPFTSNLILMCCVSFFLGSSLGAFDAGCNILMLDLWKSRDSGPYMHTLHFLFGVGAFVAPIVAKPFLIHREDLVDLDLEFMDVINGTITYPAHNSSTVSSQIRDEPEDGTTSDWWSSTWWTILTLYPALGGPTALLSLGYIYFYWYDSNLQNRAASPSMSDKTPTKAEDGGFLAGSPDKTDGAVPTPRNSGHEPAVLSEQLTRRRKQTLVFLTSIFIFLYVGAEVTYGTFIAAFSVESKLGLTRQEGSDMAAIFWGCFAGARGLAIFASIVLRPEIVMWTSFLSALGSSVWLTVYAECSTLSLQVGTALLGLGFSSMFATGLLWLEKRIIITNRIGSCIFVCSSLGAKILPMTIGQTVEKFPMSLMYCNLGVVIGCGVIFTLMTLLGGSSLMVPAPAEKAEGDIEGKQME